MDGCELPKIVNRSIVSAAPKTKILQTCRSEQNMRELEDLDWAFIARNHQYRGNLDLSHQIAFLELAIGRNMGTIKGAPFW